MRIFTTYIITSFCLCMADEATRFIPATPGNITIADSTPLPAELASCGWKWLPDQGNGGILESTGDPEHNAAPLVLWVDDLDPETDYEVFGFFWAPGFGEVKDAKEPHHWPARFGLGMASLTTYGGKFSKRIPWIISPGSQTGEFHGVSAVVEEEKPLDIGKGKLSTTSGDTRLIRARVGVARSDPKGRLPVFMDDFPDSIHCGRTRIDGIAVGLAAKGSEPSAGAGAAKSLHSALRAGDRLSVEREMLAGADVNALDGDGLSPLFHPVAFGDKEMVKALLKAGSDPNAPGQSVMALTAAASTGDAAMVRLLLGAGAEVPAGKLALAPWMPTVNYDQSHLHPAIAAIRAGSLETLKVLLEKKPDLDLEALGPEYDARPGQSANNRARSLFLVDEAISMEHDELAAFLIARGCNLRGRRFGEGPGTSVASPHFPLLARSIAQGDTLAATRKALLRHGVPAVRPEQADRHGGGGEIYSIAPWDGLSAAISVGDLALTQELLPQAGEVHPLYQDMLLALARSSGEPEILRMIGERFPQAGSRHIGGKIQAEDAQEEEALRLLLMRRKPAAARLLENDGQWTLAVIAAPKAGGQGASLEVAASNDAGWTVVDRAEVQTALGEAGFANPWGKGEQNLADLGDRVSADLLVLVSMLESPDFRLLRFEAVDVTTGLAVHREHVEQGAFDPEKSVTPLLARIREAFLKARSGGRPKAITMLPFSVSHEVANARALSGVFRAAVHSQVDGTPGLLSVGMEEIRAISAEQVMAGEDSMWAAAFTLEGGVAALGDDRISLTLRLRTAVGKERSQDATEEGATSDLPDMAARAWKKLATKETFGAADAPLERPDARQAETEAARLLREGEWLLKSGMASEALPLFERANLLGADPETLVSFHLRALAKPATIRGNWRKTDAFPLNEMYTEHPLSLYYQNLLLDSLDEARALLDEAAYYQSRHGEASLRWKNSDFWDVTRLLSFIRASIPKTLPPDVSESTVRDFGADLDRFTAEYFRIRASMDRPTPAPADFSQRRGRRAISAAMLRRNPELLRGMVTMLFVCSTDKAGEDGANKGLFGEISDTYRNPAWYGKEKILADAVAARMDEYRGSRRFLHEAELALIRSKGDARPAAARALREIQARLGRRDHFHKPTWLPISFGDGDLYHFGAANLLDRGHPKVPRHSESMLVGFVHEPRGIRDWITHQGYEGAIRSIIQLEENPAQDAFRKDFDLNVWKPYVGLMESTAKLPDHSRSMADLLEGAALQEMIQGIPLHAPLAAHWRRLFPGRESTDGGAPKARLLADLRATDGAPSGLFEAPMIDNRRRLLWMLYHPFERDSTTLRRGSHTLLSGVKRQPWMIGVDCVSGEIAIRANLAHAPGLNPGAALRNSPQLSVSSSGYEPGFLAQTNDLVFTNALWTGAELGGAFVPNVGVLIAKDSGSLIGLDPPRAAGIPLDPATGMGRSVGAVAVGDEFFYLQQVGDLRAHYQTKNLIPYQIMRVGASGKARPVTVHGRRPALTPFDAADRSPQAVYCDGDRLLVMNERGDVGQFNPKDDSWDMEVRAKTGEARKLATEDFRSWIFPHHTVKGWGKESQIVIDAQKLLPGMLNIRIPGRGEARLKVELEIPEDFRKQKVFDSALAMVKTRDGSRVSGGEFKSFDELNAEESFCMVVLNQTENDLILGLQSGSLHEWYPGKRSGLFLPLIWTLPKADFLKAVEDVSTK